MSSCIHSAGEQLRGKRVAVVVFSHYPSDPRPRREAEAFAQAGAEVEVISLQQNQGEPRRETHNGVSIIRVPLRHWRGGKLSYLFQYGFFILAGLLILTMRFVVRRYDLVHVHNMPDVLVFSALIPRLLGAKVVLDLHDPMPELMVSIFNLEQESLSVRLLKMFESWSIGFSHLVLTPNIAFQKLFVARSCPAEKLRVIMNCPDEGIFQYRELTDYSLVERDTAKSFVLMYHGALVERHGLDIAVKAFASFRASVPNSELHVFGRRTPFLDQVMDLVRELGLEDSVKYQGAKSLEQIVQAIDDCDAGVIPNRRSVFTEINMPTRIFEYLARGKPVIAPRTAGIQDYFKPDEIVFFEPDDREDLGRKMHYVFAKPREVNAVVKRGQAVYRAHRWNEERSRFLQGAAELLAGNGTWPISQAQPFVKPTD
ncbi:MAG: glycosyltransferase family 4 protein [Verrucomicrobia bacterium]|nr:glycosyltransferase family 4 protein [Verrucomicrobiota bacterium]